MTITKVSVGEDNARDVSNAIKDQISAFKGKVLNSDFMGKRRFAYKISQDTEGFFDVILFDADALCVEKIKAKLNLMENLQRYLIKRKG